MKYHALITKSSTSLGLARTSRKTPLDPRRERGCSPLPTALVAVLLPNFEELQSAAMMVPTASAEDDIIEQYMDLEDVDEHRARDYLRAAWQAVCELFDRIYG